MKIYIEIFSKEKLEAEMKSGEFSFATIIREERRHQPSKTYIVATYITARQMERLSQVARIIEIVEERYKYKVFVSEEQIR